MLQIVIDCADGAGLAEFWAEALHYRPYGAAGQYRSLGPVSGPGPKIILQEVPEAKVGKNRLHLDIPADDIEAAANRLEGLGARRLRPEVVEEVGTSWIVMADPEGNEFCVVAG